LHQNKLPKITNSQLQESTAKKTKKTELQEKEKMGEMEKIIKI